MTEAAVYMDNVQSNVTRKLKERKKERSKDRKKERKRKTYNHLPSSVLDLMMIYIAEEFQENVL